MSYAPPTDKHLGLTRTLPLTLHYPGPLVVDIVGLVMSLVSSSREPKGEISEAGSYRWFYKLGRRSNAAIGRT